MKNITSLKSIFSLLFIALASLGCTKREPIGPSIIALYGPVTVLAPLDKSNANPDFSIKETTYFTAKFSNTTSWTITLVGETSGAVKTITGITNELNAANATWDGTADDLPSFKVENVKATLTFKAVTDTLRTTLAIAGVKNLDEGVIMVSNFTTTKFGLGWTKDWPAIDNLNADYSKPDGNNYLIMSGTPWQGSPITAYVNYMNIPATKADVPFTKYFPLIADASNVYFNLMVYATETPEAYLKVMFFEDNVAARSIEIKPDWVGWKLKSFRYADLVNDITTAAKPNAVTSVQFVLLSSATPPESKSVKTAFDHACFTLNKPFQP